MQPEDIHRLREWQTHGLQTNNMLKEQNILTKKISRLIARVTVIPSKRTNLLLDHVVDILEEHNKPIEKLS